MTRLYEEIQALELTEGQIALAWLGQSGYLIKAYPQSYLIIDPYLSNCCEDHLGLLFKRLMPPALEPEEICQLQLTAYLMTHHHEDHYDPYTISTLQKEGVNRRISYYTTPTTIELLIESGVEVERCYPVSEGVNYDAGSFRITGTFADHGEHAPDAVGIVIEVNGSVIYHMGDTCLHPDKLTEIAKLHKVDLLIPPINGMYGNLDTDEAIEAVKIIQPRIATPSHYWMLPGNSGGNPMQFVEGVQLNSPDCRVMLLQQGEIIIM